LSPGDDMIFSEKTEAGDQDLEVTAWRMYLHSSRKDHGWLFLWVAESIWKD